MMKVFGRELAPGKGSLDLGKAKVEYSVGKFKSGFKITGTATGRLGRIEVFRTDLPDKFLMNNWQSWGPMQTATAGTRFDALARVFEDYSPYVFTPIPETVRKMPVSDYFVAWDKRLLGFLSSKTAHPFFAVEGSDLVGYLEYFETSFERPEKIEPLVVLGGELVEDLLERYAGLIAAGHRVKINPWNPIGWCSWYQYFGKLRWEDVLKNLALAQKDKRFPFEVFQVDDGYESDIGDWLLPKPGYPQVDEIAQNIKNGGFKAGIWTAPFSASETSELYRIHPDWTVSERGKPKICYKAWGKNVYALDTSNPEVKNWLFKTFRTLTKAGFEYFKIDFLFAGAMPGTRNGDITPIQACRDGLEVIRKAVGRSFVLGCGAPLLPAVGLVDGMRVGEDTAPCWRTKPSPFQGPSAYFALKNAILRQFMHKKLWLNDPDCLILRSKETELAENEQRLFALVAGALDNMLVESDDLSFIEEEGKRLFEEAIRLRGGETKVYGLLNEDFYLIASGGSPAGDFVLAANLSDNQKIYLGETIAPRSAAFISRETG